jgi:hypothetical protein
LPGGLTLFDEHRPEQGGTGFENTDGGDPAWISAIDK